MSPRLGPWLALVAALTACSSEAPDPPASRRASATVAGHAPAKTPIRRPPNWPCALEIRGGAPPERRTYEYRGPTRCTLTPDLDVHVGCPTLEVQDLGAEGVPDRWRAFTYDAEGRLTKVEYRRQFSGPVTARLSITWRPDGTPARSEVDGNVDGRADMINTFTKDGTSLVRSFDRNHDGAADIRVVTHFDAAGRYLGSDVDQGANGSIESRNTARWEGDRLVEETTEAPSGASMATWIHDCP